MSQRERTDSDGRWTSDDDGKTWILVEPSPEWLARHSDDDNESDDKTAQESTLV